MSANANVEAREALWSARAEALLEQALREWRDGEDALVTLSTAEAAMRIAMGELPESELASLYEEPACTCPAELVERGGWRGSCPAPHGRPA